LVKLWCRAAASKLIKAVVLGILRRMAGLLDEVIDMTLGGSTEATS
jgi:hypothetical protein